MLTDEMTEEQMIEAATNLEAFEAKIRAAMKADILFELRFGPVNSAEERAAQEIAAEMVESNF